MQTTAIDWPFDSFLKRCFLVVFGFVWVIVGDRRLATKHPNTIKQVTVFFAISRVTVRSIRIVNLTSCRTDLVLRYIRLSFVEFGVCGLLEFDRPMPGSPQAFFFCRYINARDF